jgi:uncharacterized membrane protein YeiB
MPTIAAASTTASAPSNTTPRIATLDVLRGAALFGMILVHFHQRFRLSTNLEDFPGEPLIGWIVWLGVEQKAWGVFAFLFGAGFAILMRRAGADAAWEVRQAVAPAVVEAQSYAQVVMQRLRTIPSHIAGLWLPSGSFPLFLLGLLAVRRGVLDDPLRHASLIRRAAVFGAQAAMSALWLSRFRFGPLEWLWRSVSYRRWETIRVARQDAGAIAAVGG